MAMQTLILVFLAGLAAAVGQVILLRELLVLFCGNELSAGIVFACWLLWTAAGSLLGGRIPWKNPSPGHMLFGLTAFCAVLPATVLWVRAARPVLSIPAGELLGMGAMAGIALSATGPVCFITGCLFAFGWRLFSLGPERARKKAVLVYLAEAAGSGAGGLLFYFVLLPALPAFGGTLLLAVLLLAFMLAVAATSSRSLPGSPLSSDRGLDCHEASTAVGESMDSRIRAGFPAPAVPHAAVPRRPLSPLPAGLCRPVPSPSAVSHGPLPPPPAGLHRQLPVFALSGLLLITTALLLFSRDIDSWTRRLQWGRTYLSSLDTPFHNLALLRNSEQYSMFSNGLWLYSTPDPYTSETAAHITLLEHPDPKKVLLIGDYSPGLPAEILKHQGIRKLDCIQPDARLTALASSALPSSQPGAAGDARFAVFHIDPKSFVRSADPGGYDVIILSAGEPVNAEMNRFYTVEFFSALKSIMRPDGILSFGVPSSPDILGMRQVLFLKSLHMTLRECFGSVLVVPGETARFLAASGPGILTANPGVLIDRLQSRRIATSYVRDYYLLDCLSPMRLAYIDSVLRESLPVRINRDLQPACYLYGLAVWSAQVHPVAGRLLAGILDSGVQTMATVGFLIVLLPAVFYARTRSSPAAAVAFNTGLSGAAVIVAEIVLILMFQVLYGTVYERIALIVSAFMAGMALGSGIASSGRVGALAGRLRMVQLGLAGYAGVLFLVAVAFPAVDAGRAGAWGVAAFLLAALAGGVLGGMQFAAAAQTAGEDRGTMLYAADLAGAAVGALGASLFLLPVFGIPRTLLLIGFAILAGVTALPVIRIRQGETGG